jgi:hypothetical protein
VPGVPIRRVRAGFVALTLVEAPRSPEGLRVSRLRWKNDVQLALAVSPAAPEGGTDKRGVLGHTGQMQENYTRVRRLRAVK